MSDDPINFFPFRKWVGDGGFQSWAVPFANHARFNQTAMGPGPHRLRYNTPDGDVEVMRVGNMEFVKAIPTTAIIKLTGLLGFYAYYLPRSDWMTDLAVEKEYWNIVDENTPEGETTKTYGVIYRVDMADYQGPQSESNPFLDFYAIRWSSIYGGPILLYTRSPSIKPPESYDWAAIIYNKDGTIAKAEQVIASLAGDEWGSYIGYNNSCHYFVFGRSGYRSGVEQTQRWWCVTNDDFQIINGESIGFSTDMPLMDNSFIPTSIMPDGRFMNWSSSVSQATINFANIDLDGVVSGQKTMAIPIGESEVVFNVYVFDSYIALLIGYGGIFPTYPEIYDGNSGPENAKVALYNIIWDEYGIPTGEYVSSINVSTSKLTMQVWSADNWDYWGNPIGSYKTIYKNAIPIELCYLSSQELMAYFYPGVVYSITSGQAYHSSCSGHEGTDILLDDGYGNTITYYFIYPFVQIMDMQGNVVYTQKFTDWWNSTSIFARCRLAAR